MEHASTNTTGNGTAGSKSAPYSETQLAGLSSEHRMVTPAEAKALRESCLFARQRSVRPGHVHRLAFEMGRGWFLQGTPIWFCVLPDRSMLLVNGNHTLEAVVEAGVSVPLTLIYQQVADEEEAAAAYACFDIQRTRGWSDAARAIGADHDLINSGKVIAALTPIMLGFERRSAGTLAQMDLLSRRRRFEVLEEYRGAAGLLHAACLGSSAVNQRLILRAGVYSVALVTARYQPSSAEEFWGGLVHDDGLRVNDPRKSLLKYLSLRTVGTAGEDRYDLTIAAAQAWNAHFDGRTLNNPRPGQSVRFTLLGTPWGKPSRASVTTPVTGAVKLAIGTKTNGGGGRESVAVYGAPRAR
jgi:hypothetical protein